MAILEYRIISEPYPLDNLSLKNVDIDIKYINDKVLAIKNEKGKKSIVYSGLILLLVASGLGFFNAISPGNSSRDFFLLFIQIIMGLSLLVSICLVVYRLFVDLKNSYPYECELDRINGTVAFFVGSQKKVVPFRDCKAVLCETTTFVHHTRTYRKKDVHVNFTYKKGNSENRILSLFSDKKSDKDLVHIIKAYSFMMWYMDKNRPLPTGKSLDSFRQQDYERRRKDNFPPPLIKSDISMTDFDGANRFDNAKAIRSI